VPVTSRGSLGLRPLLAGRPPGRTVPLREPIAELLEEQA
jgi:hypothetical protein